jgi:hypothetical protein
VTFEKKRVNRSSAHEAHGHDDRCRQADRHFDGRAWVPTHDGMTQGARQIGGEEEASPDLHAQ